MTLGVGVTTGVGVDTTGVNERASDDTETVPELEADVTEATGVTVDDAGSVEMTVCSVVAVTVEVGVEGTEEEEVTPAAEESGVSVVTGVGDEEGKSVEVRVVSLCVMVMTSVVCTVGRMVLVISLLLDSAMGVE